MFQKHMVTCLAKDKEGDWLVTADSGVDNILIVWNHQDLYPERTLFAPHGANKIVKVALSADANYLMTLGTNAEKVDTFDVYWWIWNMGLDVPHGKLVRHVNIIEIGFNGMARKDWRITTNFT